MSDVQGSPEDGPVAGADGVARCPWAYGTDALIEYHDTEWGKPLHGERELFERIVLEGFQAGLSWRTILTKRPRFVRLSMTSIPTGLRPWAPPTSNA